MQLLTWELPWFLLRYVTVRSICKSANLRHNQPDFFNINAPSAVGVKSSENPPQLLLRSVQHTDIVRLHKRRNCTDTVCPIQCIRYSALHLVHSPPGNILQMWMSRCCHRQRPWRLTRRLGCPEKWKISNQEFGWRDIRVVASSKKKLKFCAIRKVRVVIYLPGLYPSCQFHYLLARSSGSPEIYLNSARSNQISYNTRG